MDAKTLFAGVVLLLIGANSALPVRADTETESLNAGVKMDIFTINCPGGTTFAQARVKDLNPRNDLNTRLRVLITKGLQSFQQTDNNPANVSGEGGGFSDWAVRRGASGTYDVKIYKSGGTGAEDYTVEANCQPSGGGVLMQTQQQ